MNHYIDRTLKTLADRFSKYYINWILGSSFKLVEKLSTEIPTKTRHADLVYKVEGDKGKTYIFHLEFQAHKSDEPMNLRMLGYCVRLVEKYSLPVCGTVLYLTKEAYEHENDIGYFKIICPEGKEVLTFKYNVIKLWELDGLELLKNKIVGLYPLLGLFRSLRSLHQPCKQGRRFAIRKEDIMESTIAKEIYQDGMQEGEKKGLELGRLETLQNDIMNFLLARFEVPLKSGKQLED
ncbi:MAG: Rpn family recombination-promoting nuclease/putative transposase, partial [Methanosarcinales archaeon]